MSNASIPELPLFYAQPLPLQADRHLGWRLLPGDAGFAAEEASLPIGLGEFVAAARSYPILFAGADLSPVALLGLQASNLFVEAGQWAEDAYVPAYVRRYPFVLIEAVDKQTVALGVDAASPRIAKTGAEGAPLFEPDGKPAAVTQQALEFCRLFGLEHARTRAFCEALAEAELLVERRADIGLPDGRRLALGGFKVVDPERFQVLADDKVIAWHRNGWAALVAHHLASLERFQTLIQRQGARDAAEAVRTAMAETGPAAKPPRSRGAPPSGVN